LLDAARWYHFHPDVGLVQAERGADPSRPSYAGSDLLAMARGEFAGEVRLTARRLMRQALASHLGDAPLKSRDLFRGRRLHHEDER
jgi:DNA repair protein RecO (recombination protein O)